MSRIRKFVFIWNASFRKWGSLQRFCLTMGLHSGAARCNNCSKCGMCGQTIAALTEHKGMAWWNASIEPKSVWLLGQVEVWQK